MKSTWGRKGDACLENLWKEKEGNENQCSYLSCLEFFFLLRYPSEKGAISASQTGISSVSNYFIDIFLK